MCGIAGFVRKERAGKSLLKEMGSAIQYRGPDDHGEFLEPYNSDYLIGLAHRRLSILDLSPLGHQPMFSDDKKIAVIFNGEIYNFQSTRKSLEKIGHRFKSNSDTEVLIKSYQEWGIDFIHQLNGMFSIALYDRNTKDFYLIRDRMGVKPLYYFEDQGGLIFGSELKALMVHPGFKKTLNKHALSLFLYHGYITAPHTIFENTYKLKPGTYLHFKDGKTVIKTYWSLEEKFKQRKILDLPEEEWVKNLEGLLKGSVKDRMISDVPIGCFLSGGIDSSLVATMMQKVSTSPIKTFTIGFHSSNYDEAPYAKQVAQKLGTEHSEVYLSQDEAKNIIPEIPYHYDEPFADSSQIPMMLLSKITRKKVTVALSGDGGDELFCGYGRYEDIMRLKKLSTASRIGSAIPFFKGLVSTLTENSKYTQFFELGNEHSIINSSYLNYLKNSSFIKNHISSFDAVYNDIMLATGNFQEKHMLQDMITYLPDDILTKVDRASMAFSLEARTPFIDDHRLVEFSFQLPHAMKYKNNQKKYILKKLLYKHLPQKLMDRPKMGFGVPIYDWLRGDLRYLVDEYLSPSYLKEQNIFNERDVLRLKERFFKGGSSLRGMYDHGLLSEYKLNKDGFVDRSIWHLLIFQMWYKKYL